MERTPDNYRKDAEQVYNIVSTIKKLIQVESANKLIELFHQKWSKWFAERDMTSILMVDVVKFEEVVFDFEIKTKYPY